MTIGVREKVSIPWRCLRMCAGHGAYLGGESPSWAESIRFTSLGKGVHREVGSEGSRWQSKVETYRKRIRRQLLGNLALDRITRVRLE